MGKTALVISGGGSKGAFAVGVVRQLSQEFPDINFDILVGTSTGALIVPLVALEELDLLEQIYTSVKTEDIILEANVGFSLLNDISIFDATPLGNLLKVNLPDNKCQQLLASPKDLYIVTTCLQTQRIVYFSNRNTSGSDQYDIEKLTTASQLRRAIMASASQPAFMQPIEVRKGELPVRQYVDGGVREYAGLKLAIDTGADEIFVVLLSTGKPEANDSNFDNVFDILKTTMDIFITDVSENDLRGPSVHNRALRYVDAVKKNTKADGVSDADINSYFDVPLQSIFNKKPLKIHVIRPASPLGGGPGGFVFDPAEMQGMLAKGKFSLTNYMASLPADGDVV